MEPLSQSTNDSVDDSGVPEYEGPPRVLVMVKPPAYETYRADVIADLELSEFQILSTKDYTFTVDEARRYFSEMASLSSFDKMITEITSGPCFIILACKKVCFGLTNLAFLVYFTPNRRIVLFLNRY